MKWYKSLLNIFFMIFWAGSVFAENPTTEEKDGSDKTEDSSVSRYYPRPVHPPGYYSGAILIVNMGGNTYTAKGNFLDQEKLYDERVRDNILTGNYKSIYSEGDGLYLQPKYSLKGITQADIEYGYLDHFGLGISVFQYSISVDRQNVIPGIYKGSLYYNPIREESQIYKGDGLCLLFTYHPFSRTMLDPYIALRGGIVGFSGDFHPSLEFDPFNSSNSTTNGYGMVWGGALGINFYFSRGVGMRAEGTFYRKKLQSDQFDSRYLSSTHFQFGFFVNYSNYMVRKK